MITLLLACSLACLLTFLTCVAWFACFAYLGLARVISVLRSLVELPSLARIGLFACMLAYVICFASLSLCSLRLAWSLAELAPVARTELVYLICLALLSLCAFLGLLSLFCLGWFGKTALRWLVREARFFCTDDVWFAGFVLVCWICVDYDLLARLRSSLRSHVPKLIYLGVCPGGLPCST